jgi:hypothetical protein
MATESYTLTLPKDIAPGMVILMNVPDGPRPTYRNDKDCEVEWIKKLTHEGRTVYEIRIILPTEDWERPRKSTRYVTPKDRLKVKDKAGE